MRNIPAMAATKQQWQQERMFISKLEFMSAVIYRLSSLSMTPDSGFGSYWLRNPTNAPVTRVLFGRQQQGAKAFAAACVFLFAGAVNIAGPASAQEKPPEQLGVSTGLTIPRYVSLKSGTVNMRRGPAKDHGIVWTYKKAGLPVEITAEFENWRKIRDWEGSEGWISHTLLSGRRTVMVAPWQKKGLIELYKDASISSPLVARVEPKVVAKVSHCNKVWCEISGNGYKGFIRQKSVWGVYPDEKLK